MTDDESTRPPGRGRRRFGLWPDSLSLGPEAFRVELCREILEDMDRYGAQMKASKKRIRAAVAASSTSLEQIYGCGPICAATIIGQSGNIARFASRAHCVSYNAPAPIEASSGNKQRHRLNPKGNVN